MTNKGFKIFFSTRFHLFVLPCRKVQIMIEPLSSLGEKPQNVCFQLLLHEKDHQQLLY